MPSPQIDPPVKALDAATVILMREGEQEPEVYLMARNAKAGAFAGAHVFPGGIMDPADSHPELADFSETPQSIASDGFLGDARLSEKRTLGLYFCALRETFEEAGVLLGVVGSGADADSLSPYRQKLNKGELTLLDMAKRESMRFRLDLLTPHTRWITPKNQRKRYDTRFFLARLPEGQKARPDGRELISGIWVGPKKAMEMHHEGNLNLLPPTFMTLFSLSQKKDIDDIFNHESDLGGTDRGIQPILPQTFIDRDEAGILLPNDPEYKASDFKRRGKPGKPSRIVMKDGKWEARSHNRDEKN